MPDLIEHALRFCSKPAAASRVPQYLSFRSGEVAAQVAGETNVRAAHGESDLTEKLAFDLLDFIGKAARIDAALIRLLQTFSGPLPAAVQSNEATGQPQVSITE